jgi:predicted nucleic acid-binding protein
MKKYLLDTNMLAAYLHHRKTAVDLVRPWIAAKEVATSIVVYGEVVEYLHSLPSFTERHAHLRSLLRSIYPYFLTYPILERYALLRRQLRHPYGTGLIGDIDTLIAATALERNLTIVTTDHDFTRVPHLRFQLVTLQAPSIAS